MSRRKRVVDIRTWFDGEASLHTVTGWLEAGPRDGWEKQANCRDRDVQDLFFPGRGGTCRPAKDICAGCAIRPDCLAAAMANNERDGVWGGLNTEERDRLSYTLSLQEAS